MKQDLDAIVIGAGPYGLASAAFLRRANAEIRVFGEPMGFWRDRMPAGMILRSQRRSSHIAYPDSTLSLDSWADAHGEDRANPVPLDQFLPYALWYAEQAVPDVDRRRIESVESVDGSLQVRTEDGEELRPRRVVIATGLERFAYLPELLADVPAELASHSGDHASFDWAAGRRVLVMGAGQSALESAALLHEAGAEVELVGRRPEIVWLAGEGDTRTLDRLMGAMPPPTDVGWGLPAWLVASPEMLRRAPADLQQRIAKNVLVPAGAAWLRQRLADVPLTMGTDVVEVKTESGRLQVMLDDGSRREVDHLIGATGWRVDASRYEFLSESIRGSLRTQRGYPVLTRGLESSVPGLHFVGAPASMSFGPIQRFVVGTWYAAPVIARAVTGRRQRLARLSYRPRTRSFRVR